MQHAQPNSPMSTTSSTAQAIGSRRTSAYKVTIPEQLYVALQDAASNSAVVKHPDPGSSAIGTWTRWDIPLTDFVGVNLQAIKKLSIGVGDRANTQAGGSGDLYIDDIGLHLP